ncbi:MAG: hypothetical protein GX611_09600 [Clostridiales bacterium]|nr:hypothetical protein [Clostridiales bacterium]
MRLLMDEGSLTQEEAARKLGKSRPAVANLLRLLQLPEALQDLVREGQLSEGHARVLAGVKPAARQMALADKVLREGLSVRALEALAKQQPARPKAAPAPLLPEFEEFQDKLREAVGVRAQITGNLNRGRIVLRYASFEELEGIYEAIDRLLQ